MTMGERRGWVRKRKEGGGAGGVELVSYLVYSRAIRSGGAFARRESSYYLLGLCG